MAALCKLGINNTPALHQLRASVRPTRCKPTHRHCRSPGNAGNSSIWYICRPRPRALGLADPYLYFLPGCDPPCRLPCTESGKGQGCSDTTVLWIYFWVRHCYASAVPYVSYIYPEGLSKVGSGRLLMLGSSLAAGALALKLSVDTETILFAIQDVFTQGVLGYWLLLAHESASGM